MKNFIETDDFYKLIIRNKGKSIILDFPSQWIRIQVSERGIINTKIGKTLKDIHIPQNVFDKSKKSDNLQMAVSNTFDTVKLKRSYVIRNEKIKRIKAKNNE